MLTTLRHFSADAWTDQLAADWAAAYGLAAATTSGAAEQAAQTEPAAWPAEIIQVDHRTFDIAVLTVRTGEPVPYLAGQSVAVEQDPPDRRPSRHRNPHLPSDQRGRQPEPPLPAATSDRTADTPRSQAAPPLTTRDARTRQRRSTAPQSPKRTRPPPGAPGRTARQTGNVTASPTTFLASSHRPGTAVAPHQPAPDPRRGDMDSIGDQFLSQQRVLVIAPHADDETYGCAGTIARIKDLGGQVHVCLISVGSLEHYASNADGPTMRKVTSSTRLREFSEVMKLLKVDDWEVVYTDDSVHLALDTIPRKELVSIIERDARLSIANVEPTLMLIPAFSYNQDHEALFRACI